MRTATSKAHQETYRCFDEYEACLRGHDHLYVTPNRKARIFAYCEAVGAVTGLNKDYGNAAHWNADAPILEPLKEFLCSLARGTQE